MINGYQLTIINDYQRLLTINDDRLTINNYKLLINDN